MNFSVLKEASLYPLLRYAHSLRESEKHRKAYDYYNYIIRKLEKSGSKKTAIGHYILAQSYKFSALGIEKTITEFKNAHQKSPNRAVYITHYLTSLFNHQGLSPEVLKNYMALYSALDVNSKTNIRALNKYYLYLLHTRCKPEADIIRQKLGSKIENKNILALKYEDITTAPEYAALNNYAEFSEYILKHKDSLCVVGNSAIALGKGNGKQIDSHEVVIRINNFSMEKKFKADYGNKTNVWVRGGNKRIKERPGQKFDFILYSIPNIFYTSFDWKSLPKNQKLSIFPQEYIYELSKILDAPPSSGILILYSLYKLIGPLKRKNLFGFAFTDHINNDVSAHYFEDFKVSMSHAWEKEKELFNKITTE